ncbi:MAG: hypothetical protein WC942_07585 [Clostridia bacterium]|jgi:hypothetical protein
MKFNIFILILLCISSITGIAYTQTACYPTQEEHNKLIVYEHTVRSRIFNEKWANYLIAQERNKIDAIIKDRCQRESIHIARSRKMLKEVELNKYRVIWTPTPAAISVASFSPQEDPISEATSFYCRADSKQCFTVKEDCLLDGLGNLFECISQDLAACVGHNATYGATSSCFSNSVSCADFCSKREYPFEGKFACFDKCTIAKP